ncbi:MAG: nucleotidyltransferase domain-containing protein, partial [Roseiflexus sp.]|nr:nucleotidyltransferase domain-containing protein [Roseiflexus sp.]
MRSLTDIRHILDNHRETLTSRFGVRRVAIFGSYARQDQTPLSDVDIAVELERPLGWEIVDLHDYLEE